MTLRRRATGLRTRLQVTVLASVALGLAAIVLLFNLLLDSQLSHDVDDVVHARASAELTTLRVAGGRIVAAEAPDDAALESQVWVFADGRALERPRVSPALDRAAVRLGAGPARRIDAEGTALYSVPVVRHGRRLGGVVAGASLAPYEHTRNIALVASLILAAVLLAGLALVTRWLLTASLRPVAHMTREAAEWSEHDPQRRFALGDPHDELTSLAATLDDLLDRLAAGLRREQRFSAELSHELRTPLARISAEAELALRQQRTAGEYREALESVLTNATRMTRAVDALVAAARAETSGSAVSDAWRAARGAADACADLAGQEAVGLDVPQPERSIRVLADLDLVQRVLSPVIENACRHARSQVRVSIVRRSGTIDFAVHDDGPGVGADELDAIFEPGRRGRTNGHHPEGIGLGLALARRLADAVHGEIAAKPGPGGHFHVRLPAA